MPLYHKKWWKKVFQKKESKIKVDVNKDINAVTDFITDLNDEKKIILKNLTKLQELEKEFKVANSGIIQINLETQAKLLDKILESYEFFQNDVDINGIRVKRIAKEFLKRATKVGLKDLVKEKKTDQRWSFQW